jgi:superfamily II DNA/RNA helicase
MEAVRKFSVRVIVSTDVMARGVDFDRVNLVVNLDLPPDAATYVHRVGRTGRFGTRGLAVAILTLQELQRLQDFLQDVKGGKAANRVAGVAGSLSLGLLSALGLLQAASLWRAASAVQATPCWHETTWGRCP